MEDEAAARRAAYAALQAVWSDIGRPGAFVEEARYIWLLDAFTAHASLRFGKRLEPDRINLVVEVCLRSFLGPLYLRHVATLEASPEDLFTMLDNHALDMIEGAPLPGQAGVVIAGITPCEDDELVSRIFGVGGEGAREYKRALRALRQEGRFVDYLVVTQFVDMTAADGGAMPRNEDVAERLQGAVPGLSGSTVMGALLQFSTRLQGS